MPQSPKLKLVSKDGEIKYVAKSHKKEKPESDVAEQGFYGGRAPKSKVKSFRQWLRLMNFSFEDHIDFVLREFPIDVGDLVEDGIRVTDRTNIVEETTKKSRRK